MTENAAPDLAGLCADVAAELDEVTSTADGERTVYARGGAVSRNAQDDRPCRRAPR